MRPLRSDTAWKGGTPQKYFRDNPSPQLGTINTASEKNKNNVGPQGSYGQEGANPLIFFIRPYPPTKDKYTTVCQGLQ